MQVDAGPAAEALLALGDRARPLTLAGERTLPLVEPLARIWPHEGLARGSVVRTGGAAHLSLAWALAAEATRQGSWLAVVGVADLGLVAAAELGVDLERVVLVDRPEPARWAAVTAALADAFDVVLAQPRHHVRPGDARRLQARARERGGVLVLVGPGGEAWPEAPDLSVLSHATRWSGLGRGHGHLQARRIEVEVVGRRGASAPQRTSLWLPGPGGGISWAADRAEPMNEARLEEAG